MNNLYEALEILNKEKQEITKSSQYKLGNNIKMYLNYIVKFQFKKLIRNIKNKRASHIIKKRYYNPTKYNYIKNNIDYTNCKIAIYTCIIGNYDKIQKPLVQFENVDYYILTDNPEKYEIYNKIYKIIKIPDKILQKGNIIANRYVKFHPIDFFANYDYSIYLDGNVRVISDIRTFINRVSEKIGISMHSHRERNCIYEEMEVCKLLGRGNSKKMEEQLKKYQKEGFPKKFGMNEATVIVSDLKNEKSSMLLDEWYNEFIKSESLRDQLAWPYILWKNNYKIEDVGNLGDNIYENYKLEMVKHENY